MSRLRLAHPFFVAVFPLWSLYGLHAARVPPGELLVPLGGAVALACLALGLAWLWLRDAQRAALVASAAVAAFWLVKPLAQLLPGAGGGPALAVSAAALAVAVAALARALRGRHAGLPPLNAALAAGGLVLVILPAAGALPVWRGAAESASPSSSASRSLRTGPPPASVGSDSLPDIYWLILDAHGRDDVLAERYGVDEDLSDVLRHLGFFVAEQSAANYSTTIHSVVSSLNFAYVQDLLPRRALRTASQAQLVLLAKRSRLVRILRARGYRFVAYSSGWSLTEMPHADEVVEPPRRMGEFELASLNLTPLAGLAERIRLSPYDLRRKRILAAIDHLPEHAEDPAPTFVFWHMVVPHHPFVFGPDGEDVSRRDRPFAFDDGGVNRRRARPGEPHEDYLRAYAGQVRFLAKRLGASLQELMKRTDGEAIVIVQGDHGPNSTWPHKDPAERMPILNAYSLPDGGADDLYPSISPVNTFRVVLNRYLGAQLALLDDRHYLASYERPFQFERVPAPVAEGGMVGR